MHKKYFTDAIIVVAAILTGATAIAAGITFSGPSQEEIKSITLAEAVRIDRIAWARENGCKNPEATVKAVEHSPLADLLISQAIQESNCNPEAIGRAGEIGGWQVIESDWGTVPKGDLAGQADQAEKILTTWLKARDARGDFTVALARYNGGETPPSQSFKYANQILERQQQLTQYILEKTEERAGG